MSISKMVGRAELEKEACKVGKSKRASKGGYCQPQYLSEKRHAADMKTGDHFIVEELLDFSNDDPVVPEGTFDTVTGTSTDSSTVTVVESCNSSFSGCEPRFVGDIGSRNFGDTQFSGDLCVPYDDLVELEWLSNFVEESFSSEDLQKLQLISGMKARAIDEVSETQEFQPETNRNTTIFRPEVAVPGKARSKRSRAAPCNWTSRLLLLSPTTATSTSEYDVAMNSVGKKAIKAMQKDVGERGSADGRKCLHCATDKTPQWRTGPMGPKTLCNACGVRYKSGRLVPEYRPAASPTFVLTKHSNSHRKVLELRRQKELVRAQQQQQQHFLHQNMIFDVSNGDDYLIHQHVGPDYRQLI
ncbi:GATA transcription factor 12 [Malania oleifera]|uniref:GATA transcription factor 12 n=1 Tax=Malania oleifera TaxID=397392 RepID=UPI0025ADFCBF|nr:GATA transcription factor 12 [Malania oleifera]